MKTHRLSGYNLPTQVTVAHYFNASGGSDVARWFVDSVTPSAIESYIGDSTFNYLVADSRGTLAGAIAIRDRTHVHHLFVAPAFQRRGVATRLWRRAQSDALADGNSDGFSVRSTEYAVAVYERFGFRVVGPRTEKDGVVFVPMRLVLDDNGGQSTIPDPGNLAG